MEASPSSSSEGNPQDAFEKDAQTPIRLIDALSTISSDKGHICFKAAEGWDFHVISHTWTQDVRNLSTQIGGYIGETSKAGPDAYNKAFEEHDFSREPCYVELRNFLHLLVVDGVTAIWFDALCINQIDEEEKSREIRNMGEYYSQSKGCYVLLHGLGNGYQFWVKKESGGLELPSWFTRVWTFQEFLLPHQLSFIVEGLDERFIAVVNRLVTAESKNGLCKCFLGRPQDGSDNGLWGSSQSPYWVPRTYKQVRNLDREGLSLHESLSEEVDQEKEDKEEWNSVVQKVPEILSSNVSCAQCHSLPMIRKARSGNYGSALQIYLVDREAYLGVVQAHSSYMKYTEHMEAFLSPEGLFLSPEGIVRSLYKTLLQNPYNHWRIWDVMIEIRKRNCSIEEDRVLSVLGLLGVQMPQLRTGKGLEKQLLELAKVCSPKMLAELCAMEGKPCHTVGMSWAPDLRPSDDDFWISHGELAFVSDSFDVDVGKRQISAAGSIKLFPLKVLSGHVCCITTLPAALRDTIDVGQFFPIRSLNLPAHFIIFSTLHYPNTNPSQQTMPVSNSSSPQDAFGDLCCCIPLDFKAIKTSSDAALMLNFKFDEEYGYGQFQVPINFTHSFPNPEHLDDVSFQVRMVHLGGAYDTFGTLYNVMMVCLSNAAAADEQGEEELQKIGMLYLRDFISGESEEEWCEFIESPTRRHYVNITHGIDMLMKLFKIASLRECTIGGFGADLSRYVNIKHEINARGPSLQKPHQEATVDLQVTEDSEPWHRRHFVWTLVTMSSLPTLFSFLLYFVVFKRWFRRS